MSEITNCEQFKKLCQLEDYSISKTEKSRILSDSEKGYIKICHYENMAEKKLKHVSTCVNCLGASI